MKLYEYWRSGTSYRVRLALALKGLDIESVPVDLRTGAQREESYRARNPQGLVPTLELDDGTQIAQSPAIIEYLEECYPTPSLLPAEPKARARVRQMAALIGCDIHPLNNLRVLRYLKDDLGQAEEARNAWISRWMGDGFAAYEALLAKDTERGAFSFGGKPGLADCYLLPQLYSARRFGVDLTPYPLTVGVEKALLALEEVGRAVPEAQPDAPKESA